MRHRLYRKRKVKEYYDKMLIRFKKFFGLNNIYSGKVHDIHKYNVKIIGSDSKSVTYLDHHMLQNLHFK